MALIEMIPDSNVLFFGCLIKQVAVEMVQGRIHICMMVSISTEHCNDKIMPMDGILNIPQTKYQSFVHG